MSGPVALVLPPGWTLHPGGPHIALPILKGYLAAQGVHTELFDLNIGSVKHYGVGIDHRNAAAACNPPSIDAMNRVYFDAEDQLKRIARNFNGNWETHEGYLNLGCDLGSPMSVRQCSLERSPFTEYFKSKIIPRLHKLNPRVVGLTLVVPSQVLPAFEFVRLLRQSGYKGVVILGGNHITRIASDMKLDWVFDLVDGVVTLQGEKTLFELVQRSDREGWEEIPNLIWRRDGKLIENRKEVLKPGEFMSPGFDTLSLNDYWGTHYLTMLGARGCYYGKCTFCAIPHGWGPRKYIGRSPASHVVQMLADARVRHNCRYFKFVDEALHPKMLEEMGTLVPEIGLDTIFEGYVRFDSRWTDSKFVKSCRNAGLRKAYLGLELAPSESRDLLDKSDGADPSLLLRVLNDHGIKAHIFCLFGFPGTGIKEAVNTIDFVLKHRELIDTVDVFPFYYARHTKVPFVEIVNEPGRTWATEHLYRPVVPGVLSADESSELAEQLGNVLWNEKPEWLHPVYRMYSPWCDQSLLPTVNGIPPELSQQAV